MNFLALAFIRSQGESMKNVLVVSIALVTMPVLVQAADITEALSTTNSNYVEPSARMTTRFQRLTDRSYSMIIPPGF
jgi:hypothetical protein